MELKTKKIMQYLQQISCRNFREKMKGAITELQNN